MILSEYFCQLWTFRDLWALMSQVYNKDEYPMNISVVADKLIIKIIFDDNLGIIEHIPKRLKNFTQYFRILSL